MHVRAGKEGADVQIDAASGESVTTVLDEGRIDSKGYCSFMFDAEPPLDTNYDIYIEGVVNTYHVSEYTDDSGIVELKVGKPRPYIPPFTRAEKRYLKSQGRERHQPAGRTCRARREGIAPRSPRREPRVPHHDLRRRVGRADQGRRAVPVPEVRARPAVRSARLRGWRLLGAEGGQARYVPDVRSNLRLLLGTRDERRPNPGQ